MPQASDARTEQRAGAGQPKVAPAEGSAAAEEPAEARAGMGQAEAGPGRLGSTSASVPRDNRAGPLTQPASSAAEQALLGRYERRYARAAAGAGSAAVAGRAQQVCM